MSGRVNIFMVIGFLGLAFALFYPLLFGTGHVECLAVQDSMWNWDLDIAIWNRLRNVVAFTPPCVIKTLF